jgi:hypothetical protein
MTTTAVSPLVGAIAQNNPLRVAQLLDKPRASVDEEALIALVHLAWKTRGTDENPDRIEDEEKARQIFDLLASAGANFYQDTSRGRIMDRITKVQPHWPQATDTAHEPKRLESSALIEAAPTESVLPSRNSRGATHRGRRP